MQRYRIKVEFAAKKKAMFLGTKISFESFDQFDKKRLLDAFAMGNYVIFYLL